VKSDSQFKTLRDYVNAQPRTTTQGEIATRLGIAENTLSQYLGGRRTPGRGLALRLHRDFDISLEGLLDPASAEALHS
jgi:transcriptional regulator with XRE-family HTH domain